MKIVNSFCFIALALSLLSCHKQKKIKTPVIDYSADSLFYKLDILDSHDKNYLQNQAGDWKETILLKKELFVKDSSFGGLQNFSKAIKYAKSIKLDGPFDCYVLNSINLEAKNNAFNPVWVWKQNFYWGNDDFGEWAGRIELDEALFNYNGELKRGIKIIYKLSSTNGFKLNILNFVSNGNYWELISRESLNTLQDNSSNEEVGYCIDTINSNCEIRFDKSSQIFINDEMMFDLKHNKCY